jgi:hypothetical protein
MEAVSACALRAALELLVHWHRRVDASAACAISRGYRRIYLLRPFSLCCCRPARCTNDHPTRGRLLGCLP